MSGIDEGRQDKPSQACFLLYSKLFVVKIIFCLKIDQIRDEKKGGAKNK